MSEDDQVSCMLVNAILKIPCEGREPSDSETSFLFVEISACLQRREEFLPTSKPCIRTLFSQNKPSRCLAAALTAPIFSFVAQPKSPPFSQNLNDDVV